MEVKIVQKLVNSKPRKNFFCLLDDVKLKIIDIRGDIATMQNGNQYKTDDLRPYIMRYNAVTLDGKKDYRVSYEDYEMVLADQVVDGYPVRKDRNVYEKDAVRISDIDVIDQFALHDILDREGEIVRIIPKRGYNTEYEVILKEKRNLLKLKREQFRLLDRENSRMYFHPRCPECNK